jgi:glycosyltransferase involved in cell wall biosynthesis
MKIWFRLHGFEPCSWTYVWDSLRKAFGDANVELSDCYITGEPKNPEEYVELWWGDPQFWHWSGKPVRAKISLALSEARSILAQGREKVIRNLRESDLIVCPSESATRAFKEAPFDVPIKVVFFGADPEEFPYVERDWRGTIEFLHAGVTQFRKGSWLVPEAFVSAFGSRSDVHLTMASPKISSMFLKLKQEYASQSNISFHDVLEDSAQDLYSSHHIYVSPHLSEGFGLMIPEAMSSGMLCLVSRCSAPLEFLKEDHVSWIEMSENYAPVSQCLPKTGGTWRLPDIDSLIEGMQRSVAMCKQSEEKGVLASKYVIDNLTWSHTAKDMIRIIKEVLDAKDFRSDASLERGKTVTGPSGKYRVSC